MAFYKNKAKKCDNVLFGDLKSMREMVSSDGAEKHARDGQFRWRRKACSRWSVQVTQKSMLKIVNSDGAEKHRVEQDRNIVKESEKKGQLRLPNTNIS